MRVCLDANLFISYLLRSSGQSPPAVIMNAAFVGQFDLVLNEKTLPETRHSITSKPYLARRIQKLDVDALAIELRLRATIIPEMATPFPAVTRDPGDDFLVTHAVVHAVDYLVSGDKDLLVLGEIAGVRIVSPAVFVAILNAETASESRIGETEVG